MLNQPVSILMTPRVNLTTISPTEPLQVAVDIFAKRRFHHLPVVDDDNILLGIVTSYDVTHLSDAEVASKKVGDVMSKRIVHIDPEDKIGTAVEIFLANMFHALPITENGKLLGIISTFDVLRAFYKTEYNDEPITLRR